MYKTVLSALLALFVAVVYLPAIDAPFTFDDYPNIVSYTGAQPDNWTDIPASATHPTRQDRPVARLTFGLNYLVSGLNPTAYHLTNVVIHAAAAIVLFFLLLSLTQSPRSPERLVRNAVAFAFVGALLWAIHPVNTQAVTYIVQRMASLAGLFYLASLLVFVQWRLGGVRNRTALPLLMACFGLAVGSKMSAASAPLAWWLIEVAFFTGFTRRNLRAGGVLLAIAIGGAALVTWDDLKFLFVQHPRLEFTGVERMLTSARVLWHYVSLIFWPDVGRLQVDYAYSVSRSLLNPITTLLSLLAIIAVTVVSVVALHRRRALWPATGWLLFLVGSSVEASHVMLDVIFEQRIYLPGALLLPFVLAPIFVLELSARAWVGLRLGVLLVAVVVALQTISRNQEWAQPSRLWANDLAEAKPRRAAANASLAALATGDSQTVLDVLARARERSETDDAVVNHAVTARAHMVRGDFAAALEATSEALEEEPDSILAAYLHTINLIEMNRTSEARQQVRRFVDREPDELVTAQLLAYLDIATGQPSEAVQRMRTWLDANPDIPLRNRAIAKIQLAVAIERTGDPEAAAELYREVVRVDPQNWTAWRNLAQLYHAGGSIEQANTILRYLQARGVRVEVVGTGAE